MTSTVDTTEAKTALEQRQGGEKGKTLYDLLREQQPAIERALPGVGITAERFVRLVQTEIRKTPRLASCSSASILGACMYAAQLGIEPGPLAHCYLVPYRNNKTGGYEAQFILGYRGMIELAWRSDELLSIEARDVREHDKFSFAYGLQDTLVHEPALNERGKPIAYYGIARFKDGGHYFLVMSMEDIDKRRGRSRAKDSGPWTTDFDAMARKTVIRAMIPYLPVSAETADAVATDENVRVFTPGAEEVLTVHEIPPPADSEEPGAGEADDREAPDGDQAGNTSPATGRATDAPDTQPPDYGKWKKEQLIEECRGRDLAISGTPLELANRLREDDKQHGRTA